MKRKQYDTYGAAGFDPGQQQYYRAGGAGVDPEELFRKIFGEFTGGMGFGDARSMFDQTPTVASRFSTWTPRFREAALNIAAVFPAVRDGAVVSGGGEGSQSGPARQRRRQLPPVPRDGQRAGHQGAAVPLLQRHRHGESAASALPRPSRPV